eukprot:NODE_899_length_3285_cov_0.268048.p1 type:complete len:244 gc:universal NODE_899_length_3285_cov_0.268048:1810-2541(+)
MSTHVALAKQILLQFEVTEEFQRKKRDYERFQLEQTCKVLLLREEEEGLSNLLDEHMYLAATLDKKRSLAVSKENIEKKQKADLSIGITQLKAALEEVRLELDLQTDKIQQQIHIKTLVLQTQQEEGINTIEYIESQLFMNSVLKEAIANISTEQSVKHSSEVVHNDKLEIKKDNVLPLIKDIDSIDKLSEFHNFFNSIRVMHSSMAKAVNLSFADCSNLEECKKALLNIQSLIKFLEASTAQ